jgi:cytochrome b561
MKYHISLRVLHWLIAIIIICLLISGLTLDYWPKEFKKYFYYYHKSFGILILAFVVTRISCRIIFKTPAYPEKFSKMTVIMAKGGTYLFYALMIAIPITGYLMSMGGGHGVSVFGFALPDLVGANKALARTAYELHETFANLLIATIVLHISAVLKHYIIDKENLLKRMW